MCAVGVTGDILTHIRRTLGPSDARLTHVLTSNQVGKAACRNTLGRVGRRPFLDPGGGLVARVCLCVLAADVAKPDGL